MIYFDNASTSYPKPESIYKEMDFWLRNIGANPSRSSHKSALSALEKIYNVRELVCKLIGASNPNRIIFTANTTDSLNIAIKGFLKSGDHVITTNMEHNSMIRPIISLSSNMKDEKIGITHTISSWENIENHIKPNTKLIAVTHGSNVTGAILDIEKIGKISKKHNIALLVDAAQTAGEIPIDVEKMNIDFLAAPGHKALFGPQGTGILYIRDGIKLSPIKEGGTGSFSESLKQPSIMPDSLESGTLNSPGIIGLGAGIKFILSEKIERITEHKEDLTKYFLDGLKNISGVKIYGVNDRSSSYMKQLGVISINIKEELSKNISYALDNIFNIATRAGLHCAPLAHETIGTKEIGTVRFSLSYFNTREDINKGLDAISKISKSV